MPRPPKLVPPRQFVPAITKKPDACAGCPLETVGKGYVPGDGPLHAPTVLVGEGPWYDEVAQGHPMIGASGAMLTRILRVIGRQREQYQVDNVTRCPCPSGSLEKWPDPERILSHCRYVDATLANPHVKVVVPMGGVALRRILGLPKSNKKVRIQDFHGTVQKDAAGRWVVPTYHPAHIVRGATNLLHVAAFDLARAQEVAEGKYVEDVEDLILDPPVDWFAAWVDQAIAAMAQDPWAYPLAVDIETPEGTATKGEVLTAAADDSYKIVRVNFSIHPEEGVTVPFEEPYIGHVLRLLAAARVQYYWFKGYDVPRLWAAGAQMSTLACYDIMWAWKALQADLPMGLGHAAPFYCRGAAWKHLAHDEPAKYGAIDGVRTRKVGDGILGDLQRLGRANVFYRHQHRFHAYVLQPATDVGLAIDRDRLATFKAKLDATARGSLAAIQRALPDDLRPLTPKLGLTKRPMLAHTRARDTKKDGTAKKDAPDPIKAEVYAAAEIVERLVLREVYVCKTCEKVDVIKAHNCGTRDTRAVVVQEVASVTRYFWQEPFNPDSPPQILALGKLFKLDPGKDKKTGNDSVGREVLQRWRKELAERKKDPVAQEAAKAVDAMLQYKAVAKVRGTYVVGIEKRLDADDRVHGEFTFKPNTMRLCVAKGTLIEIVRDVSQAPRGIPIEDVRPGMLAYTFDENKKLTVRPVTWAGQTGTKRVIRLHWMSGFGKGRRFGYTDLTPEHRVRLYDGTYCEAARLRQGHRTLALVRGINPWGYARLWASHGKQVTEHIFLHRLLTGERHEHVHHLNHNRLDNRPENLTGMTASAHTRYHGQNMTAATKEKHRRNTIEKWAAGKFTGRPPKPGLQLSRAWLESELDKVDRRPTYVAKAHGIDYTTLMKYIDQHGIECRRRDTRPDARNHLIVFVEHLSAPVDVYDLEVAETHNFIAGEICVHNSGVNPNLQNVRADKDGKESIAAGFRSCVVARGRWVEEGSEYADV